LMSNFIIDQWRDFFYPQYQAESRRAIQFQ